MRLLLSLLAFLATSTFLLADPPKAEEPDPTKTPAMKADVEAAKADASKAVADAKTDALAAAKSADDNAHKYSDIAWLLVSAALVMLMMPGLALFYGGMARRKNVLGTMMHTFIALGLVGVQWVCFGYSLSFGESKGGVIGFSPDLLFLGSEAAVGTPDKPEDVLKKRGIAPEKATDEQKADAQKEIDGKNKFQKFPNTKLPLYLHAMFQGMFAIITVALISGAFAERVKFLSYCIFALLWTTLVYDPVAHWVWAYNWTPDDKGALTASGILGQAGAIDFAGGTVVHIAAGASGLAAVLLLRKRSGYGKQAFHPNSMILTLLGAGLLWFGWFGFNGGSALMSNGQAVSAFAVTQIAAATAGLAWTVVEWLHRGKPTALGFASGLVAGLVAITPASGFVAPGGALVIGLVAGVACYWAVAAKSLLGYDDSLDAFGIHGVGGFIGAILTGVLVSLPLWAFGAEMEPKAFPGKVDTVDGVASFNMPSQVMVQTMAACGSAIYAFIVTAVLVLIIDKTIGFTVKPKDEAVGLDLSQHGEIGLDVGQIEEEVAVPEPKAASKPPAQFNGHSGRFTVVLDGADPKEVQTLWADLCKPTDKPPRPEFVSVYKHLTTMSGNKFKFRGGNPVEIKKNLEALFADELDSNVKSHVEH